MKRLLPLLLLLSLVPSAYSQQSVARAIARSSGAPSGACYGGAVRFNAANNGLYLCGPNSTWTLISTGGVSGIGGSGTANQFPIFTAGTTIGNSILTQGTNLIEQKSSTNAQTFRVYETTANTGSVAQIQALSAANTVRMGSKQLASGATARAAEFGYEQSDGTFLGWIVSTAGNLNAGSSVPNAEIGNTAPPKSLYLGSVGNGTGFIKMTGVTGGSGTLTLSIPDTVTTHTLKLPGTQGAASSVLTNDGSGGLSWAAASGGGVAPVMEPSSKVPVTSGSVFENVHVSAGSGHKYFSGLGIANATTIAADSIWALEWNLPPVLPTGTATLETRCIANLTSGALKINVKWNVCAIETDCSGVTLNAEGTQTITWGASDNDQFKQLQTVLDASTMTADTTLIMNYTIEDTGTTIADTATCKVYLTWR